MLQNILCLIGIGVTSLYIPVLTKDCFCQNTKAHIFAKIAFAIGMCAICSRHFKWQTPSSPCCNSKLDGE
jgi:hypothetical protein